MRRRIRQERGAFAILFAIVIVLLITMVAIAVDLTQARAETRSNQSRADFAALAAAQKLPDTPLEACQDAWTYIVTNMPEIPGGATSPCSSGVPAAFPSSCVSSGADATPSRVYEALGEEPYIITFTFPVDNDDPLMGGRTGVDDGDRCQRFGVSVRTQLNSLFGGIVSSAGLSAPATSVSRGLTCADISASCESAVPALLILDPVACNVLTTSGQAGILVNGAVGIDPDSGETIHSPGYIAVDSTADGGSGSNNCNTGGRHAIEAGDNPNNAIVAGPDPLVPGSKGLIQSYGMAPGQTRCDNGDLEVCEQGDVDAIPSRLSPMPKRAIAPTTRAPVDYRYNCNETYPGITNPPNMTCEGAAPDSLRNQNDNSTDYIDRLRVGVGTSTGAAPAGDLTWFPGASGTWNRYDNNASNMSPGVTAFDSGGNPVPVTGSGWCSPNVAKVVVPAGNWWVSCGTFSPSNQIYFLGGNVVFDGTVSPNSSAVVSFNSPISTTPTTYDPTTCTANPNCEVGTLKDPARCTTSQSSAFIYVRAGNFFTPGSASRVLICNDTVYVQSGNIGAITSGDVMKWIAPFDGPFEDLALWSEGSSGHDLGGQSGLQVEGVFFTPTAQFTFHGQSNQAQQHAQFIAFRLAVTGQGVLNMQPDPFRSVPFPFHGDYLIR